MKVSYSDLSNKEKEIIGDGCGTRLTGRLVPDLFFNADCDQHDFYYLRGGDFFDKIEADVMFYAHMLKSINNMKKRWYQKPPHVVIATVYFFVVFTLGLLFFSYGKYKTLAEILAESQK